jgi:plastocyanin
MHLTRWLRSAAPAAAVGAAMVVGGVAASAAGEAVQIVTAGTNCASPFCFIPATVNAGQGDGVTWTNTTVDVHTVTRCTTGNCSGQDGESGGDTTFGSTAQIAASGGTYQHTFASPGTYFYYCAIHGYAVMHGEVAVAAAPPPSAPESVSSALLIVGGGAIAGGAIALAARRRLTRNT